MHCVFKGNKTRACSSQHMHQMVFWQSLPQRSRRCNSSCMLFPHLQATTDQNSIFWLGLNLSIETMGPLCPFLAGQVWLSSIAHAASHVPSSKCRDMLAGYTGVQPRPEQVRGTPDHTQRPVKPTDPDLLKTHCRLIPSYAGLASAAAGATGMHSTTAVPRLNLAAVSVEKGHAGMCQHL